MDTFIDGFTSRISCNHCHYAMPNRISDITIGDFWGLGKEISDEEIPEHKNGISCMLPISDKGLKLIEKIQPYLNIYERPVSEAINGNDQLRHPKYTDWRITIFRNLQKLTGVKTAYYLMMADKIAKYKIRKILKR